MEKTKILFVCQEITPYLPETEMSIIGRYLPQGIQEKGKEIRTFMPRFGIINERRNQLHEVIRLSGMNLIIDDTDHALIIKVASIQSARMQVYFIDNDDYFQRKHTFCDANNDYFKDNDERGIFYVRGVIETIRKLRWSPDLVHCHGWFSAFMPLYIKKMLAEDPLFAGTKTIFSVYDDFIPQTFTSTLKRKIKREGISDSDVSILGSEPNYLKIIELAMKFSDGVILGSKTIPSILEGSLKSYKKPILPYQSLETYIDAYANFYQKILAQV